MQFRDRKQAGELLAQELKNYANKKNTIVLALPRGGVPVAYEVAKALNLPLDIFLVRKLGLPGYAELAMGAIAMGDIEVLNSNIVRQLNIPRAVIDEVKSQELKILAERNLAYRGGRELPNLNGKDVILIDDGVATGATMRAALTALKKLSVDHLIIAVPVLSQEIYPEFANEVDAVFALQPLEPFSAIGAHYQNFGQTSDEEVINLLASAKHISPKDA